MFNTLILLICSTLCNNFLAFLKYLNTFLMISKYTYKCYSFVLFPWFKESILFILNFINIVSN